MKFTVAQLQEDSAGDRVIAADDYVVVLDGATSFDPDMPEAGTYADVLGSELSERLSSSAGNLRAILAEAIRGTAGKLSLVPGYAPSSTVAIARHHRGVIDTLLLGDSYIVVGSSSDSYTVVTDSRLAQLNLDESREYRLRLSAGSGYDNRHRRILRSLQRKQCSHRNRSGGYWIAEADPNAAEYAISSEYRVEDVPWIVLATDGATDCLAALDISWLQVAQSDADGISDLLGECHRWEEEDDPTGCLAPRAKQHDDKTLVVVTPG
ncbi:hypothetical protein [Nocardia nova]|uniref:hypothetical protein n=1 Tax=Nocardia nova TaxID=37330 RepID=UPI003408C25F